LHHTSLRPGNEIEHSLLKTHRLEEFDRSIELSLLSGSVPAKFLSHDLDNSRKSVDGSVDVEEGEPRPTSDEIGSVLSVSEEGKVKEGLASVREKKEREKVVDATHSNRQAYRHSASMTG